MKQSFEPRVILAFGITLVSILGISILSWAIITSADASATERGRSVFNAILPLLGAWVGTVLAFYFSRENFIAASNSTRELVRELTPEEKLRSIPVATMMITDLFVVNDQATKVHDLMGELSRRGVKRVPILSPKRVLEALLFQEGVISYLYSLTEVERPSKTIADLLTEKPELKQTPVFVDKTATLAVAKAALEQLPNGKVVFVTDGGKAHDPVVGMLTNTDIARHSKA